MTKDIENIGAISDPAKRFLDVAILLFMDLDLRSGPFSPEKNQIRMDYAASIREFAIPIQFISVTKSYGPQEHELLHVLGDAVSDIGDIVTICSELVLLNPWGAESGIYTKDIDEHVRRLFLKEVAAATSIDDSDIWIDLMLGRYLELAISKMKSVQRNPKKWMYAAAGAAMGGFVLAPHIGAAVGMAMGLSGAAGTSAGLALLGGGSIASGGLGMLGGTYLVAAASTAVGAGAGAVAENVAASKMSANVEAIKLTITIESLRKYGREDLIDHIRNALRRRVEDLAGQKVEVASKSQVEKWKIKEIEKEEDLLLAVVPKVVSITNNVEVDSSSDVV